MSEPSPEAVVAAEAAGNAVEALHAQQEVTDAAMYAQAEAGIAVEVAGRAEDTAETAAEGSSVAIAVASDAAVSAEVANETAQQAASSGDRALQEIQTLREQMGPVLQSYADAETARVAALQDAQAVSEVDVTSGPSDSGSDGGNTGGNSGSTSGNPGTGPDSGDGASNARGRFKRGRR